jgi:hypothetical protein
MVRPRLEALEGRLAPAIINWVNRNDFDNEYGGNTMTARQVIDTAILEWSRVIQSFNYRNIGQDGWAPTNAFELTINVADLGDTLGKLTTREPETDLDGDGKPFKGFITMDNDAVTSDPNDKEGWYFDPNAGEDFEYKSPLTPWAAAGGPENYDFYSVILHEVGHALGFRYTANSNIQGRITNNPAPPPEKIFHFLDGSTVFMTLEGGLHLWDGTHKNDLMSPSLPSGHRNSISDLDARILADAYGYTIDWGVIPFRSFVTTFDAATRELTVWGDLGTTYEPARLFDDMKLDVFTGGFIFADVNGYVKRHIQSSVSSIKIIGGELNDRISVGGTAAGQTIFIQGGKGDNSVLLSHNAKNLNTIQGDVRAQENGGTTTVTLHDENATAKRTFTAFGSVEFQGSNAKILYDYVDTANDLNNVIIRGGGHGNTYTLSNDTVRTSFRVDAGLGADTVNILSTFGGVRVEGGGGRDTVTVGDFARSGLRDVKGLVSVSNVAPFTDLILDDSGDPNANPNVQITSTNVTGLGPAEIIFDRGELASLTIQTGTNNDTVQVGVSPNGLAGLPQNIRLEDSGGTDQLTIRNVSLTLDFNRINGVPVLDEGRLTNFPLSFADFENLKLEALGGLSSSATLLANPIGVATVVESFRIVNVGGGNAGNIRGNVTVSTFVIGSFFVPTDLTVDDSAATTPKTIEVGINNVAGVSENNINFAPARISKLTVNGGRGGTNPDGAPAGNTVILHNTRFANQTSQYVLNAGAGPNGDTVQIHRSNTAVTVNGQRGLDTVNVGVNGSTEDIDGTLHVTNVGSWTALHIDDSATTTWRNVTLSNPNNFNTSGRITGLTSFTISYRQRDLRALEIKAGSGHNIFTIANTPTSTFAGGLTTSIKTGSGNDTVRIQGTKGTLDLDVQAGINVVNAVSFTAGLDNIAGTINLRGPGGSNHLNVYDSISTTTHDYVIHKNVVQRTDRAAINFQDVSTLTLAGGQAYDQFFVGDTGPKTTILTNGAGTGGDDYVSVARTTGELILHASGQSVIEVGNNTSSLDNIQSKISVLPAAGNLMTLRMIDTATTSLRLVELEGTASGQTYKRTNEGGTEWRTLVEVLGLPITNFEYWGGSGGTTFYTDTTAPGTTSRLYGHTGAWDTFAVGWAGDMTNVLGEIQCFGEAADNDFSYYYEFLNPNPQTYTVGTSLSGAMLVERAGVAKVTFNNLAQVVFYTPHVGGNSVNVRSSPAPTVLNMAVGAGDDVTLGSNAPNLNGSMAGIQGPIVVGAYANAGDITLIADNSGDATPRAAELFASPSSHAYYEALEDFGPAGIYWNLGTSSNVSIRGGTAADTFAIRNTEFVTPIHIDGGAGVNTLDYAGHNPTMPGLVSWWKAENNGLDAVSSRHGTLVGDTAYTAGKVGQAFRFDGNGDYVKVSNAAILEPTAVSVEAWVNSNYVPQFAEYKYILAKGAAEFRGASYALTTSINSGLWFYVGNGSAFGYSPDPGAGIWDGNWHHVVGTYDGNFIRLYVDGVEVGNGSPWNILGYGLPTSNDLYIGTYGGIDGHGIDGYSFNGLIDEPAVFNRALSAEEIQRLFAGGAEGKIALTNGVTVNLRTSTASGLAGGIANIHNVVGSSSHDILVGNGGNVLTGGDGRDLLIAGLTASQLFGGEGEDILIGGTTIHDEGEANLNAIRDIWTSDAEYNTRVQTLRDGLLDRDVAITSNGQQNTLHGQGGLDFFFLSGSDLHDAVEGEELVGI